MEKENKEISIEMNLYDINKAQISNLKPMTRKLFKEKCEEAVMEIMDSDTYWMLLCRERNDYTIFKLCHSFMSSFNALYESLLNRGKIIDFIKLPDNNYEIWVRDLDTEENFAYYLFNYKEGVVEA